MNKQLSNFVNFWSFSDFFFPVIIFDSKIICSYSKVIQKLFKSKVLIKRWWRFHNPLCTVSINFASKGLCNNLKFITFDEEKTSVFFMLLIPKAVLKLLWKITFNMITGWAQIEKFVEGRFLNRIKNDYVRTLLNFCSITFIWYTVTALNASYM